MVFDHFGLKTSPFPAQVDETNFFYGPVHDEALARLQFLVDHRRRLGLMLGASGSGKSTVLKVFAGQMRRPGCDAVILRGSAGSAAEFGWSLATALAACGLGSSPRGNASEMEIRHLIQDQLASADYQARTTILLIDDAEEAPNDVQRDIARLIRYEGSGQGLLCVVLAAQQQGVSLISRRILELVDLRIDIEPWTMEDTVDYLVHCVETAGGDKMPFEQSAIDRIHTLCCGIPRRVSKLADLSLLAAAGDARDQVDAEMVESVYEELGPLESTTQRFEFELSASE